MISRDFVGADITATFASHRNPLELQVGTAIGPTGSVYAPYPADNLQTDRYERKHPVNNAAREALGGMVGPRLMTKAGLL